MRGRLEVLCVILAMALLPPGLLVLGRGLDPYAVDVEGRYQAPNLSAPFGTDGLGRSVLARTTYATGLSLRTATASMGISFVLALVLGGLAGLYSGRWPDRVISWLIALLFTVPFILIVIAVFSVVRPTLERAYLAIACIGWAAPARIVRAQVIQARSSVFVLAERALGFPESRILLQAILPVCWIPAGLSLLYFLPELIGIEVGLSFFGLGAEPPTPSLGRLIYDGLAEFSTAWWLPLLPAVVLLVITTGLMATAGRLARRFGAWTRPETGS